MPSERPGTFARLGRALLDATLMLIALVLLLLVVLTVQVRGIVADVHALVEARALVIDRRLDGLQTALEQAEAARSEVSPQIAAEIAALRVALQSLSATPPADAGSDPGVLRRFVVALLAASAVAADR